MTKKLTAKTQELNPKLPQYSSSFSKCVTIKPENQETLLKKGTLYVMFDISGDSNFDTELVCKVIYDVLHDSYFNSESISPVQSMEKSIIETKEKILQLSSDTLTANPQSIVLNMSCAVLWGNVLYIVRFGSEKCYAIKDGAIIPLEMTSEGNFSTFSKIVNEDEILIFCTNQFEKTVPPEKLLTSSLLESDLEPDQTCLLMRLVIDTSFSQNEVVDFGLGEAVVKNQTRIRTEKILDVLKGLFEKTLNGIKRLLGSLKFIAGRLIKRIPRRRATLFTRNITQLTKGDGNKTKGWIFLSAVTILLAVSVFFAVKSLVFKSHNKKETNITQNNIVVSPTQPQEDRSKDAQYKVIRVNPEVFYDIRITDSQAEPTDIQIVGDKIVATDKTTGKLYISDVSSPSFKIGAATFPGIKSLANSNGLLSFNDSSGYKTFDLKTLAVGKSYTIEGLNLSYPYAGFIYTISGDTLTKETEKADTLEGVVWAKNPDFVNARSMAIAYSIYILKSDGELVSYSGGNKDAFAVSGLEKSFNDTTKVVADIDLKYIYVSDRGNKSVVVFDDKGNLIKQYKTEISGTWNDIRGISVSSDEKALFVLNSGSVYKVPLSE